MIELIKKCLALRPNIFAYKINERKSVSKQLFYIFDKLEMNRVSENHEVSLTIYMKKDDSLGENEFNVYPYDDEESLLENIDKAIANALNSLNPYYDLPKKEEVEIKENDDIFEGDIEKVIKEVIDTTISVKDEHCYSTATEFFFNDSTQRIINSFGVDLEEHHQSIGIELIPTYEKDNKEVEVYEYINISNIDLLDLKNKIVEALKQAKDRYLATPLSIKGKVDVIIQEAEVSEVLSYFSSDANYMKKHQHTNRHEIGDNMQGNDVDGDLLTINMIPYYKGAFYSSHFDNDGVVLTPINILKDGVLTHRYGSNRFGQYIKEERPTGNLYIKEVSNGNLDISKINHPYIRCVKFSGIQLEENSGFVGGEVRLGYYFDGVKEIPVTGFSISGNMNELKKHLKLSKEETTLKDYHGPKYLLLKDMEIA